MLDVLNLCRGFPLVTLAAGEVLIREKEKDDRLYVLAEGAVEVYRDNVIIAFVSEPGAVFGEMSLLLGIDHTANVRAIAGAKVHVIDDAIARLRSNPALLLPIAQLLARRLRSSTTYLVDLKKQFEHHRDHFGMMDEILESLSHQQGGDFKPGDGSRAEP